MHATARGGAAWLGPAPLHATVHMLQGSSFIPTSPIAALSLSLCALPALGPTGSQPTHPPPRPILTGPVGSSYTLTKEQATELQPSTEDIIYQAAQQQLETHVISKLKAQGVRHAVRGFRDTINGAYYSYFGGALLVHLLLVAPHTAPSLV